MVLLLERRSESKTATSWTTAAEELGGEIVVPDDPKGKAKIKGTSHGCTFVVEPVIIGSGRRQRVHTRYGVRYAGPGIRLHRMTAHGRSASSGPRAEQVTTGDPDFDARVFSESTDRTALIDFLTPERRQLVLKAIASWPGRIAPGVTDAQSQANEPEQKWKPKKKPWWRRGV